jgi:hypothetical protein
MPHISLFFTQKKQTKSKVSALYALYGAKSTNVHILNAQIAAPLHPINELLLIGWRKEKRNLKSETTSLDTWRTQNYSENTVYTFYRCTSESQSDSLTRKCYRPHPKKLMHSLPLLTRHLYRNNSFGLRPQNCKQN